MLHQSVRDTSSIPLSPLRNQPDPNSHHSIQRDPSNPKLFTNRALTRQKLLLTSPSLDDCLHAISLDPSNMKAFYYLSQAQLALHRPNEAHASALTAYNFCVETGDRSIQNVSGLVLQTKKAVWEGKERQRIRERDSLLRECLEGLERNMREEMGVLGLDGLDFEYDEEDAQRSRDRRRERSDIQDSHKRKVDELQSVFAIANPKDLPRPVSPRSTCFPSPPPSPACARGQRLRLSRHHRTTSSTTSALQSCTTP